MSWYFSSFTQHQPAENLDMAEHIVTQTVISAEEALRTEIILNQALIDILISKKVISEDELINGIRKIKRERDLLAESWDLPS
jgi:hypothetical protein